MAISEDVFTSWGHLDTAFCGPVIYDKMTLSYPCGLGIADELWKELSARDTEMINRVHRRHHEAGHSKSYWYILTISDEGEDWYKLTFACSCDGIPE